MLAKLVLTFPRVGEEPDGKPAFCPSCGSPYLSRHGRIRRPLTDTGLSEVAVQRYRCSSCGFTFRHYPAGVSHARRSDGVLAFAIVLRHAGLSCIATAKVLAAAGLTISQATVWRAVRKSRITQIPKSRHRTDIRVLGQEDPCEGWADLQLRCVWNPETKKMAGVEIWGDQKDLLLPRDVVAFLLSLGATLEEPTWEEAAAS